jgi:hypothetical protein
MVQTHPVPFAIFEMSDKTVFSDAHSFQKRFPAAGADFR